MILVTGATGHVGRELVGQLLAQDQAVRAMTRRPDAVDLGPGVEVVYGDCDDLPSLDVAFHGVDRAFLMSPQPVGSAEHPTYDLGLVEAAQRAGVHRLVKLSVYTGGDGDDAIATWHREAEAAVTESGMDWALLRPGRFMSNALQWAPMLRRGDTVHIPFADRPTAPIDPADVAAVARLALTTDARAGTVHQLSGPELLTPADELAILAQVLGRSLRLVEPPLEATKAGMSAAGMPAPVVEAIVARVLAGKEGAQVLPTVAQILGQPPTTFAQWAAAHTRAFSAGTIADTEPQ